jgi:hypothetical protein
MKLNVCELEFNEHGGNTIWIHAPNGSTTLRIKCTGKVIMDHCVTSPVSHGDLLVQGDIHICVPPP